MQLRIVRNSVEEKQFTIMFACVCGRCLPKMHTGMHVDMCSFVCLMQTAETLVLMRESGAK